MTGTDNDTQANAAPTPYGPVHNTSALTKRLPLKLLRLIAPENPVEGKDAITVVFNRAVIALGSDFGPVNHKLEPPPLQNGANNRDSRCVLHPAPLPSTFGCWVQSTSRIQDYNVKPPFHL